MTKSLQRATVILAGAAALASGCGDGGSRETSARDTPPQGTAREPVSLARDGGEIFTYRPAAYGGGPSVDAGSLEATARRVKARAVALKLRLDAEVRGRALVVTCVACSTSPPAETGRLAFYDWEANVRDSGCQAAPTDPSVTGGASAGQPGAGSLTYYEAVTRAAKTCRTTAEPDDTTRGLSYGVSATTRAVVCGPQTTKAAAARACRDAGKRPTGFVEVPRGYLVIRSESDDSSKTSQALARDAHYIVKDDPALDGHDIEHPEPGLDPTTGQPRVTFDFTADGRRKWQKVTREISRRGQAAALPGVPINQVANHFAIVLDNRLISVPYIDPQQNPDGVDGSDGAQISGSLTMKSAQRLVAIMRTGALPLSLDLVSVRHVRGSRSR